MVIEKRKQSGIGLGGRYESIARWLFKDHKVIASVSWIEFVIREAKHA